MSACRSQTSGPRDRKELIVSGDTDGEGSSLQALWRGSAQDSDEPEVTQSVTLNPEPYIPETLNPEP